MLYEKIWKPAFSIDVLVSTSFQQRAMEAALVGIRPVGYARISA